MNTCWALNCPGILRWLKATLGSWGRGLTSSYPSAEVEARFGFWVLVEPSSSLGRLWEFSEPGGIMAASRGFQEKEKMFLMASFSGKPSATRKATFTLCFLGARGGNASEDGHCTVASGDSRAQTLQDPAVCGTLSPQCRNVPPLALPGTLCRAGGALQSTSAMRGSMLFVDHLQLP